MSTDTGGPLDDRPQIISAALLDDCAGVVHGFGTRHGGVSPAAYASLNVSSTVGDGRAHVQHNRLILQQATGCAAARFLSLAQVHGGEVVQVTGQAFAQIKADGFWTRDAQVALCIVTADCVPVLMADCAGQCVGAAHAGWRGTQARIAATMVERLDSAGIAPGQLRVSLGPAIGPCCFEVGHEVAAALRHCAPDGGAHVVSRGEAWTADLWALNVAQLMACGVPRQQIEVVRRCTCCDDAFFSYRRASQALAPTGRQGSMIALRPLHS